MAVLEKVMQLKQQGATEPQIIGFLKQEGISPKEIDEALSQSKIKSMINTGKEQIPQPEEPSQMPPPSEIQPQNTLMQPNMIPVNPQEQNSQQPPQQPPQQPLQQSFQQQFQQQPMQQIPSQAQQPLVYEQTADQYAPPQEYYEEYAPQQSSDIETINDIAEQIVEEKNAELKKQISTFTEFKDSLSLEVEKINERISRMENVFNELQVAILKKIGDYGENLQNIEKEMNVTQDSFSKILDPLTDNIREMQKITRTKTTNKLKPKSKKTKPGFEDYLR